MSCGLLKIDVVCGAHLIQNDELDWWILDGTTDDPNTCDPKVDC